MGTRAPTFDTKWQLTDTQGSVIAVLNHRLTLSAANRLEKRYQYDSFGTLTKIFVGASAQSTDAAIADPPMFAFQGREVLQLNATDNPGKQTLLLDFGGGRLYNSRNARWLTPTPTSPSESNGYRFQHNQPKNNSGLGTATTADDLIAAENQRAADASFWKRPAWESYVPIWGSFTGMMYDIKRGDYGMAAINGAFLAVDVGMLATSFIHGGSGLMASTGARIALRAGLQMGVAYVARQATKQIATNVVRQIATTGFKQIAKAGIGAGTSYLQNVDSSEAWEHALGGAIGGLMDPTYATYGRAAGTFVGGAAGYVLDAYAGGGEGARGFKVGMGVGGLVGGFAGATAYAKAQALEQCGSMRPVVNMAVYEGSATVIGGAIGYALDVYNGGDGWDGLLQGAQYGQMVANAALMISPKLKEALLQACFSGDTKLMARGTWGCGWRRIDEITLDDEVLSRDEYNERGLLEWKRVEELFRRLGRIWHLHVRGEVVRTTGEHPFYVWFKGWLAASELQAGDWLLSHDGQWVAVEEVYDTGEYETAYNLRVADFHTYFVGSEEWGFSVWAHNQYAPSVEEAGGTKAEKNFRQRLHEDGIDHGAAMQAAAAGDWSAFNKALKGRTGWNSPTQKEVLNAWEAARGIVQKRNGYEDHHLMTNKNDDSLAEGGPYTPKFEELAELRGWDSLDHHDNIISLQGHQGPHARYNRVVWEIMSSGTKGRYGDAYNAAYDSALLHIKQQTLTPGTRLNRLATGQGDIL